MRLSHRYSESSDAQLVQQTLAGDTPSFGRLVQRHLALVHGLAYVQLGNHTDAEDLAQDTFVSAYRSLDTLRDPRKFPGWIVGIARNLCSAMKRARAREREITRAARLDTVAVEADDLTVKELRTMLHAQLHDLDETARETLVLHYFAGKTTGEIAEICGISRHAAKKRLERARDTLGQEMAVALGAALEPPTSAPQRLERVMGAIALQAAPWRHTAPGAKQHGLHNHARYERGKHMFSSLKAAIIGVGCIAVGVFLWKQLETRGAKPSTPAAERSVHTEAPPRATRISPAILSSGAVLEHDLNPSAAALVRLLRGGVPGTATTAALKRTAPSNPTGPAKVKGFVLAAGTHRPVSGARVVITLARKRDNLKAVKDYDPIGPDSPSWVVWTNANGEYAVDHLPYTPYTLVATSEDASATKYAFTSESDPVGSASFEIGPTGVITGSVRDAAGYPIANAQIVPQESDDRAKPAVISDDGGVRQLSSAPDGGIIVEACTSYSGSDGAFQVQYLPKASWKLAVKAKGYASQITDFIPVGSTDFEVTLSRGGAISGRVVEAETGIPVSGIQVVLKSTAIKIDKQAQTSADDGQVEFYDLADGAYALSVEDEARVTTGDATLITVQSGGSVERIDIATKIGGSISGRVFYADTNVPVEGVVVRASIRGKAARRVFTDANGVYRIEGLLAGQYELDRRFNAALQNDEGVPPKSVSVVLGEEVSGVDFPVKRGLTVRGRVVDTAGKPVDHAMVTATQTGPNGTDETEPSREDGTFVCRGFPLHAEITITARKGPESVGTVGPLTFGEEDMNGVEVVVEKSASIAGTVVNKSGVPIDQVYVLAMRQESSAPDTSGGGTGTDSTGRFRIDGLQAGSYAITMRKSDSYRSSESQSDSIQLAKGQEVTDVRLVLDDEVKGLSISGRVTTTQGTPIKDARIDVSGEYGHYSGGANSDASGNYVIHGLDESTSRVSAHHADFSDSDSIETAAGATGGEHRIAGPWRYRRSSGRRQLREPIKVFQVGQVKGINVQAGSWMQQALTTYSRKDGTFRLENVTVGDVTVFAHAEGHAPASATVSGVTEGGTVSNVVVRLQAGGVVKGVVHNAAGQPVTGAQVVAAKRNVPEPDLLSMSQLLSPSVTTNRNGEFTLDSLAAEEILVRVTHSDYVPAEFTITPQPGQTTSAEFVLGAGGTVSGVVRVGGKPASDALVIMYGPAMGFASNSHVRTDASGAFTLSKASEGTVQITVHLSNTENSRRRGRSKTRSAEVAEGKTTVVDFDFPGGNASIEGAITVAGQPPKHAWVNASISSVSDGGPEVFDAEVGADGHYRLDNLPVGTVTVNIFGEGQGSSLIRQISQVRTVDGQVTRLDSDLNEGASISGALGGVDKGETGIVVALHGNITVSQVNMAFFAANQRVLAGQAGAQNGAYKITNLAPGRYTIVAMVLHPNADPQLVIGRHTNVVVDVGNEPLTLDLAIP